MPLPQTRSSIIDALGRVRQTIADLQRQEKGLEGKLARLPLGHHQGMMYTATVTNDRGAVVVATSKREARR